MSSVSVWLVLRASETCIAPSASRSLRSRLQTRVESKRHGLLTAKGEHSLGIAEFWVVGQLRVGVGAGGGILELL